MKLDLTHHKQTPSGFVKHQLWNMRTIQFLHVTGCGLDITLQGHFLKCAPPTPPPSHFLHTQTKAASLGKVLGHLCFFLESKPAPMQTLWLSACLYTRWRSLQPSLSLCDAISRLFGLFRISSSKPNVHNLAHPNIRLKVSTRIWKRWGFIALAHAKEQHSSQPPALIWLLGRSGFPRWVPTVWTNSLLSWFQMHFRLQNCSPHQSKVNGRGFLPRGQTHLRGHKQDTIVGTGQGQSLKRELWRHNIASKDKRGNKTQTKALQRCWSCSYWHELKPLHWQFSTNVERLRDFTCSKGGKIHNWRCLNLSNIEGNKSFSLQISCR